MVYVSTVITGLIFVVFSLITVAVCFPEYYALFLDTFFNGIVYKGKTLKAFSSPTFPFGTIFHKINDPKNWMARSLEFGKDHSGFHVEWVLHKAVLVVNDFDLVQKLLGLEITIKKTTRKGDETLPVLKKLFGKGLFMIRSHEWKRQHRVATRGMGSKHIKAYTPVVIEVIKRVVQDIEKKLEGKDEVDIDVLEMFQSFASETTMRILFGGELSQEDLLRTGKKFCDCIFEGMRPINMLTLYFKSPLPGPTKLRNDIDELHAISSEIVKKFRKDMKEKDVEEEGGALLKALCRASDEGDTLTDEEVVHNVYAFAGAGIDTTSTGLTHLMITLAERPEIQEKMAEEILAASNERDGKDLTIDESLAGFPYTSAVIKESLRLFPPVGALPFRHCTVSNVKLGPATLAKNTPISAWIPTTARSESWWGPDAKEFRPERFLEMKEGRRGESVDITHPLGGKFLTFSGGVRSCIGKKLAAVEFRSIVAMLLEKFEFRLLPEHEHLAKKDQHWEINNFLFKPREDRCCLRVKRRVN
ncbi:hypothetical protein AAMO2058_000245800 [Amorphochlora amoebiformis]